MRANLPDERGVALDVTLPRVAERAEDPPVGDNPRTPDVRP